MKSISECTDIVPSNFYIDEEGTKVKLNNDKVELIHSKLNFHSNQLIFSKDKENLSSSKARLHRNIIVKFTLPLNKDYLI